MIFVDSHEWSQQQDIVDALMKEVVVEKKLLPCGDFLLTALPPKKPLIVERKTACDLVSSIASRRLFDQLIRMKQEDADVCIILEGDFWDVERYRKWATKPLTRLIDTILFDWNIPIMPTLNRKWTTEWLIAKSKDLDKPNEKREYPLRSIPRKMSFDDQKLYILEGAAGHITAKRLLEKFITVHGVAEASEEELLTVEKIGPQKAKMIRRLMNE